MKGPEPDPEQRILDEGVMTLIDLSNAPTWVVCVVVLSVVALAISADARRWVNLLKNNPPSTSKPKKAERKKA